MATGAVKFGKYELLERLAKGGMAEIFLARALSLKGFEKILVIKRIRPTKAKDPAFIQMFLDEARVAASLDHPNVVQIYDVGCVEDEYFIAMEYLHGVDLQQMVGACIQKGMAKPPLEATLTVVSCALAGLHYAHDKRGFDGKALNIVHRDITPQNVVVTYDGGVKVVDFGIATARIVEDVSLDANLRGKAPYMSPEQARGEPLDRRSDIFAAGILLFELSLGRRLYKSKSEAESRRMITEDAVPDPLEMDDDYPPKLREIVMRALAKDRTDRFQSAREMQEQLDTFCREARLEVGYVPLGAVMEQIFDHRLQAWREAEKEGKNLLDHIRETAGTGGYSGEAIAGAGRDLSWFGEERRRHRLKKLLTAAGTLTVLAAVVVVAIFGLRKPQIVSRPTATRGTLRVETEPAGAELIVDGVPRAERTPCQVTGLKLGRPLNVEVKLAGYSPYWQRVTPTEAMPGLRIRAALKPIPVDAALPVDAGTVDASADVRHRRVVKRGYGYLTIATAPWAELMIDNRPYGQTPQVRIKLRAGRHRLRLFNSRFGIDRRVWITIRAGRTQKKRYKLK